MSRDLIKHVDTWGKNIPEEGTANAGALSILEFTWLVGGIARRPAWPELRMQELRPEMCVWRGACRPLKGLWLSPWARWPLTLGGL